MKEKFYERLEKEYKEFIDDIKTYEAEYIVCHAYEIVAKEEIVGLFEPESTIFETSDIKALNKLDDALDTIYDDWVDSNYSHTSELEDSIRDTIKDLKEYQEMQKKNKEQER